MLAFTPYPTCGIARFISTISTRTLSRQDWSDSWMLVMASTVTAASVAEQLDKSADVLTWLNNVLNVPDDAASSDPVHAATLDALQTATSITAQTTSAALEHIIDDIARATPRLAYDIHLTRDGALALRNVLAQSLPPPQSRITSQPTTDSAEPDATSTVLERLQHLDTLRTRMEAARDVLREAESWSALEAEVTTLLAEKAYARAASRLSASARLMPVSARTVTTPGTGVHEPRRALLTSLANQLEAALSPDLVRAVTACDVESCKSFYTIFVDIEREGEFRNYYYGTRRSSIVEAWSKAFIGGEPGSSEVANKLTPQPLSAFYPSFLSSFLTVLNGERTAVPNIFPDPERTLSALIYTTLSVLAPPPVQCLAALSHNGNGATALKDVVRLFQTSEEFARGTQRIFEKLRASAPPLLTTSTSSSLSEGKFSRRRSMRMSMSWRSMSSTGKLGGGGIASTSTAGSSADEGAEWDQCLFQPFLDFQVDFGALERRLLDDTLGSPLPGNIKDLDGDQAARTMRERAVDVFSTAEESIERCLVFTYGYASVGLVHTLDAFVSAFVGSWTNSISSLIDTNSQSTSSPSAKTALAALDDDELADLDYTSQDWAHIQKALHLLAAGRAVKDRLGMFEIRLWAALGQVSTAFRTAWGSGGSGVYTPGATKGEGLLLAQSSLNSLELRELLTRVAPSTKPAPSLLPSAHTALTTFARANQRTLQHVLLSPLYAHLATYPTLSVWSAARVQAAVPGMAGVVVPTFSLSPSEVAHRVGDGLLNLPRLFEVYAEDDALGFELGELAGTDGAETATGALMGDVDEQGQVHSAEAVTAAWLSSLGRATVVHLTRDVLPQIKTLSVAGAAQLSADLGYLETIVRALGVEKGDLERWKAYAGMTDEEGRARLAGDDGNDKIGQLVAKMRKWTV